MRTAKEWEKEYAHGHPNWTYAEFARAIQADALEAAALVCDALANGQRRYIEDCHQVETVVIAAAGLSEQTAKQNAADIRKLKETL